MELIYMDQDRRRHPRLGLSYLVEFKRGDGPRPLKAAVDNINSTGFHCTADVPFSPGERLECSLYIPRQCRSDRRRNLVLHRRVKVIRVEINGLQPGFGVACQFEDYSGHMHAISHPDAGSKSAT